MSDFESSIRTLDLSDEVVGVLLRIHEEVEAAYKERYAELHADLAAARGELGDARGELAYLKKTAEEEAAQLATERDAALARATQLEGKLESSLDTSERLDRERMEAIARAEKAERELSREMETVQRLFKEQTERDTAEAIAVFCDAHGWDHTADLIRDGEWRSGAHRKEGT